MGVLTATAGDLKTRPPGASTYAGTTSDIFYQGGLVGVVTATGLALPWRDTATDQFQGVCIRTTSSDGLAALGEVDVDVRGVVITNIPIASAVQASVGERVYCTTDNVEADCALTATSLAIGTIIYWRTAADCDIQLFTPQEANAIVAP
jgi:hypothetical protein